MAAKLKVFTWSDGFHAFTVAASSRPRALAAWGIEQDLFKTGLAREADDGADKDAALAAPGAVISRSLSVDLGPEIAVRPKTDRKKNAAKARERLQKLQDALAALDSDHDDALEDLDRRQASLDEERSRIDTDHAGARKAVLAKLKSARAAA